MNGGRMLLACWPKACFASSVRDLSYDRFLHWAQRVAALDVI